MINTIIKVFELSCEPTEEAVKKALIEKHNGFFRESDWNEYVEGYKNHTLLELSIKNFFETRKQKLLEKEEIYKWLTEELKLTEVAKDFELLYVKNTLHTKELQEQQVYCAGTDYAVALITCGSGKEKFILTVPGLYLNKKPEVKTEIEELILSLLRAEKEPKERDEFLETVKTVSTSLGGNGSLADLTEKLVRMLAAGNCTTSDVPDGKVYNFKTKTCEVVLGSVKGKCMKLQAK